MEGRAGGEGVGPPGSEAPEAGGPVPGEGAPPPKGLSTGAKVAIGCGGLVFLGLVGAVIAITAGGFFLKRQADEFSEGLERQVAAGETLERLAREHPFDPPEDGALDPERVEVFFEVTDAAFTEVEPWARDLERAGAAEEGAGRLSELTAGIRGMGGMARSREVVARHLDEHGMSLGEYVWTGFTLLRARDATRRADDDAGVPPANLELAREHRMRLDELADEPGEDVDRSVVLALATVWGMSEPSTWRALGLDTLAAGR